MIFIFTTLIRSSIVVLMGLLAVEGLRKQQAALRHWVLAAVLAIAAAQPAINLVVPAFQLPTRHPVPVELKQEGNGIADVATSIVTVAAPESRQIAIDSVHILGWLWAIGAAISLTVLAFGAIWLSWLERRSVAANDAWRNAAESIGAELRIVPPVRIAITRHPALLVTWGLWSPVILLPADSSGWSAERIQLVLAHEMAHLARRDWIVQLAAETLRAAYWFNPLFWVACARLRRESEHACDDIVLQLGVGRTSYASHLVDLARAFSAHGRTWLPAPSIARPSTLERRVLAMLNPQLNRRPVSIASRMAAVAILLAIALPIAAAAQAPNTPSGTVLDPSGRPLADAALRLRPLNGSDVFDTRTDTTGAFQFSPVPRGEYILSVRYPGFSTQRARLQLSGGGATIDLRVQVGALQETITVTASSSDTPAPQGQRGAKPAPPSCAPSTLGGQLIPPMKTRDVRPRYRQELKDAGVGGTILMRAQIGQDGKVRNVDVISPVNADLEDDAIAAVSQWEFTPTYLNCEPVEVQMFVSVTFKLDQ